MVRNNGEFKGKINWFTKPELVEAGLVSAKDDMANMTDEQYQELKEKCVQFLSNKGFVFFDYIGYRVITGRTGKVKEFGVQFHHIK